MPERTSPSGTYLAELTIRDFAIIDRLHIDWAPGFNVLTGETGAGKSIIVDALGAALGGRVGAEWVRAGAERASVEAVVAAADAAPRLISELAELGCGPDDGQIILTRDILAGRSVCRVNGRAVPLSAMQQLAQRLVDVHSQAGHLSLLQTREHRGILDRFGQLQALGTEMSRAATALDAVRNELRHLEATERQAEREALLLRHEMAEIDAAAVKEDEDERLVARRSRLRNALRLQQLARGAHHALQGSDEQRGALDLLGQVVEMLGEIRALDQTFRLPDDRLVELIDAGDELDRALRRYADTIEDDPGALEAIEDRMLVLADLKRKYGVTLRDVLAFREQAAARLQAIEHREERLAELRAAVEARRAEAGTIASRLSHARAAAASDLEAAVERGLADLGMGGTRFSVQIRRRAHPDGLLVEGEAGPVGYDSSGIDQVEFQFSANPGEPPRPLARVASGGELARFMLAVKSVLSGVDETPILIFDELDQGVGGRMGHVIGAKLAELARRHQVLCITHLPQVAAYADAHFLVTKQVIGSRAVTGVTRLDAAARVQELATMLAGPNAGPAARRSAEELLQRTGLQSR